MEETRADDMPATTAEERVAKALAIAMQSGGVDGAHHKAWVIDQMVRALTGAQYPEFVQQHNCPHGGMTIGEFDGAPVITDEYEWDVGIAP